MLTNDGRAAIQVITMEETYWDRYKRNPDFIQQYIFPGGMLPTNERLRREVRDANLKLESCNGFGTHYAKPSRRVQDFRQKVASIKNMGFDEHFRRMWRYYFCYCEAGFRIGRVDVVHTILSRD